MVTKIYIDKLLTYVPLNGLVFFCGFFYRKGRTNRIKHKTLLFRCASGFRITPSSESLVVPMCLRVNYFKEDGAK